MDLFNRITRSIGEEQTLPPFFNMLKSLVESKDWRYKYSAIMALSQVGEYITDLNEIDPVVKMALRFAKDPEPKVRYAAFHCIGQLADDKRFDFQIRYASTVVPALLEAFSDDIPRTLAHALAALTNFLEGSSKSGVECYSDSIVEPCLRFLENGAPLVKENAMSAIAALAEGLREKFTPYWQKTVDTTLKILKNRSRGLKQLRGQAIECITIVGEAIGKDVFRQASDEVIKTMMAIQQNYTLEPSIPTGYLFAGWQRISITFKEDFSPYLKDILPSLFVLADHIINKYDKIEKEDDEEDGEKDASQSLTTKNEEIKTAVNMFRVLLLECSEACIPSIDKIAEIFTRSLKKTQEDQTRTVVAKALADIICISSKGKVERVKLEAMSKDFLNIMWTAYSREILAETMESYMGSMRVIIEATGRSMRNEQLAVLMDNIAASYQEAESRRSKSEQEMQDQDIDEDQQQELQEEIQHEENLQCSIAHLINSVLKTHQELMLPFQNMIANQILANPVTPADTPKKHIFWLVIASGVAAYLGLYIPNQVPFLLQGIIRDLCSSNAEVREAAAQGISIIIEEDLEEFKPYVAMIYKEILNALLIKGFAKEEQRAFWKARVWTTIVLGKMLKHTNHEVGRKKVTEIWISNLPLAYEKEEAKKQHDMLLDIIEAEPELAYKDEELLVHILKVFAKVVTSNLKSATFQIRMKKIMKSFAEKEETKVMLPAAIQKLDNISQIHLKKALEADN